MKKIALISALLLSACGTSHQEEQSTTLAETPAEPTVSESQALLIFDGLDALFLGENVQTVQRNLAARGTLSADEINGLWDIYKAVKGTNFNGTTPIPIGFSARKAYLDQGIARLQPHINTLDPLSNRHMELRYRVQQKAIDLQLKLQKGIYGITTSAPFFVYSKNVSTANRTVFESELLRIAEALKLLPAKHRAILGPVFISDGKMRQDVIRDGKDKTYYAAAYYKLGQIKQNNFFGNIGKASIPLADFVSILKPWKTGFTILTTNAVIGQTMEGPGKVGEFSLLHELGHNVDDRLIFSRGRTLADFPGQEYGNSVVGEHAAQAYSRYFLKTVATLCQKAVPGMTALDCGKKNKQTLEASPAFQGL